MQRATSPTTIIRRFASGSTGNASSPSSAEHRAVATSLMSSSSSISQPISRVNHQYRPSPAVELATPSHRRYCLLLSCIEIRLFVGLLLGRFLCRFRWHLVFLLGRGGVHFCKPDLFFSRGLLNGVIVFASSADCFSCCWTSG